MADSVKNRLLEYLKKHIGIEVDRNTLSEIAKGNTGKGHSWARTLRNLRQIDGWQIETTHKGYILHSLYPEKTNKERQAINGRLRYAVLQRDNSTCQRCGRTIADGVKLAVDHKLPVDWGGSTDIENLWTLCTDCNGGKKNLFSDLDNDVMTKVSKHDKGAPRLMAFFQLQPNRLFEPMTLEVISNIRDWERTLRYLRQKKNMRITWIKPNKENPKGGYIYFP